MNEIFTYTAVLMFFLGLIGINLNKEGYRKVISLNISVSGTFLIVVSKSFHNGMYDPVAVAMVLTGVVISTTFSIMGFIILKTINKMEHKDE